MKTSRDDVAALVGVIFGAVIVFGALLIWATLIGGFVTLKMWGWFAVPLGAPTISFWHAVGLAMLVAWFTHKPSKQEDDPAKKMVNGLTEMFIYPALTLLFGYIVHCFM
jgi:hypothetical protein